MDFSPSMTKWSYNNTETKNIIFLLIEINFAAFYRNSYEQS